VTSTTEARSPHPYDTRALTDDQRSLADDIASAMGWGHEDTCAVWWEDPDGCSCPLLQAVADGLDGARVVEVVQELGYDSTTYRGDRLERRPFRPHPLSEKLDPDTAQRVVNKLIELHDCRDPDMGVPCSFHAGERRLIADVLYEEARLASDSTLTEESSDDH
jgi:hypothetical protein